MVLIKYLTLPGCICVILLAGCVTDSDSEIQKLDIFETVAPDTGSINVEIPILIRYYYSNSCGESAWIIEDRFNRNVYVEAYGSYRGGLCLGSFVKDSIIYRFKAASSGRYYLTYSDTEYGLVADTIVIR